MFAFAWMFLRHGALIGIQLEVVYHM